MTNHGEPRSGGWAPQWLPSGTSLASWAALTLVVAMGVSPGTWARAQRPTAVIVADTGVPQIAFAVAEVRAALESRGFAASMADPSALATVSAPIQIVLTTSAASAAGRPAVSGLEPQGYAIRRVTGGGRTRVWAIGHDAAGAMYAGLEIAEDIRIGGNLTSMVDRQVNPPSSGAASSSTSRSTRARRAIRTTRLRRRPTSPRCGAWTSGRRSSTTWRAIASTCCRSGASVRFPRSSKFPSTQTSRSQTSRRRRGRSGTRRSRGATCSTRHGRSRQSRR